MAVGTAFTADFTELAGVIATFEKRGQNLGRIMPEVAQMLVAGVDDVYEAEGPGWEPLSAITIAQRRGTTYKILQDSGDMAGSTMSKHDQSSAEAWAYDGKAKWHASGTSRMPQRNPFDLGPFEAGILADIAGLIEREAIG